MNKLRFAKSRILVAALTLPMALAACEKKEDAVVADPNTLQALALKTKCAAPASLNRTGTKLVDMQAQFMGKSGRYQLKGLTAFAVGEMKDANGVLQRAAVHHTATPAFPAKADAEVPVITECIDGGTVEVTANLDAPHSFEAPTRKILTQVSLGRQSLGWISGSVSLRIRELYRADYFGNHHAADGPEDKETTLTDETYIEPNGDLTTYFGLQKVNEKGRIFMMHKLTYGFIPQN